MRTVDVGPSKGEKFRGERIPTLAEVLAVVPAGKRIFIEVKCGPQILPALKRDLQQSHLLPEQIAIISFHPTVIEAVRKQLPDIRAYLLYSLPAANADEMASVRPDAGPGDAPRDGCLGAGSGGRAWPGDESRGRPVAQGRLRIPLLDGRRRTFGREYQALGVDSITTNRPALMRKFLTPAGTSAARNGARQ